MSEHAAWRLLPASNSFLSLIPHDLSYFRDHFDGAAIATPWTPPPVEIAGWSKPVPDFVGWMLCAPVISESARDVLESLIGPHVQLLPFHQLRNKRFYAVNVLTLLEDALDPIKSTFRRFSDRTIYEVDRAIFRATSSLPAIFKLGRMGGGGVWVTTDFADTAYQHGLTGARFLAPTQDPLNSALGVGHVDEYPGRRTYDA